MRILAMLSFCAALAASCGNHAGPQVEPPPPPPADERPAFDQARAFADLQAQVDFGPRVPGTQAHADCLQFIIDHVTDAGGRVVLSEFTATTPLVPDEQSYTNVLGVFGEDKAGEVLMLAAHWDSRAKADHDPDPAKRNQPVPAANDGASGVAVLLEIARGFAEQAPPRTVILAFFDAEDQGMTGSGLPLSGFAVGSRHLAGNWPDTAPWPDEMILLDLVGQDNVHNPAVGLPGWSNDVFDLPEERYSVDNAPDLVDRVWSVGERLGHSAFQRRVRSAISDDHVPFQEAGVEAIDIVDFAPPEWHTTHDTPENCDPASLYQVGDTLLEFIYHERP
ncbi:MAG TPA: M28 family peptidase [Armatimonadota bacterium]|nr:M28 family peptidase [Armatimonadota bacterium]